MDLGDDSNKDTTTGCVIGGLDRYDVGVTKELGVFSLLSVTIALRIGLVLIVWTKK